MKLARDQAALVKSPSHIETAVVVNSTKNCIPRDTSFGFRHPLDWHLLNISLVNWSPVCSPGTWNFLELSRLVTKWECCVLQIFPMLTTVVSWVQNSLLQLRDTIISTQLYAYELTVLSTSSSCEELRRIQSQSCQKMISSPVHICGRVFLEDDICFDCCCWIFLILYIPGKLCAHDRRLIWGKIVVTIWSTEKKLCKKSFRQQVDKADKYWSEK